MYLGKPKRIAGRMFSPIVGGSDRRPINLDDKIIGIYGIDEARTELTDAEKEAFAYVGKPYREWCGKEGADVIVQEDHQV